jgi:hypothetical protein
MPSDEATGSSIPSFTDFRVGRYGAKGAWLALAKAARLNLAGLKIGLTRLNLGRSPQFGLINKFC